MATKYHAEFLTFTIVQWQNLLTEIIFKEIILNSMEWLVTNNKCQIYAFVIMPNHVHLLWKIENNYERYNVQGALLSYTAHEFKKLLEKTNPGQLRHFAFLSEDRNYQFWQRDSMVKECWSEEFFNQKLQYIHNNPCAGKWNLSDCPENYQWSSAASIF